MELCNIKFGDIIILGHIPWNLMTFDLVTPDFHGNPWNIPWDSMEPWCHLKWRSPQRVRSAENVSI